MALTAKSLEQVTVGQLHEQDSQTNLPRKKYMRLIGIPLRFVSPLFELLSVVDKSLRRMDRF